MAQQTVRVDEIQNEPGNIIGSVLLSDGTSSMRIDSDGSISERNSHLLSELIIQQRITNAHLSLLTGETLTATDVARDI